MPPLPASIMLKPVPTERLGRIAGLPRMKQQPAKFPKAKTDSLAVALKRWHSQRAEPKPARNDPIAFKAQPVKRGLLTKVRAAAEAGLDPDVLKKHEIGLPALMGSVFSGLATRSFMEMQDEYKRRKAKGESGVDKQWQAILKNFQSSFAAAGIAGVDEKTLNEFVKELNANKENRDYFINLANTAKEAAAQRVIGNAFTPVAVFVPTTGVVTDPTKVSTPIPNICSQPLIQGSYTKHIAYSVNLSVSIPYPCCSWTHGCHWCHHTVTLAGVSWSVDLNVGYKVTCCGATAYGQAAAQVCATIVGQKVCAGCTATLTGVAGISRTPVTAGCEYGLGAEAELSCSLAGHTILDVTYSFGWVITGPCPPAGACP